MIDLNATFNATFNAAINHAIKPLGARLGIVLACITLISSACTGSDHVEIKDWMNVQKNKAPTNVPAITAPVTFVSTPYTQTGVSDPFDEQKLKSALAKARGASNASALQPDLNRKREALESYPIDTIKMIGYVVKQGKPTALLSSSGTLYNVAVGSYVGQDFGKITSINEQEIAFKELVQDGSGAWTERTTKLPLVLAGNSAGKEIKK